jgi:hypothetical protein
VPADGPALGPALRPDGMWFEQSAVVSLTVCLYAESVRVL